MIIAVVVLLLRGVRLALTCVFLMIRAVVVLLLRGVRLALTCVFLMIRAVVVLLLRGVRLALIMFCCIKPKHLVKNVVSRRHLCISCMNPTNNHLNLNLKSRDSREDHFRY